MYICTVPLDAGQNARLSGIGGTPQGAWLDMLRIAIVDEKSAHGLGLEPDSCLFFTAEAIKIVTRTEVIWDISNPA